MNESRRPSFQKTLVFAATVAALGASVGVPLERAFAAPPSDGRDQVSGSGPLLLASEPKETEKAGKPSLSGNGAVQGKIERRQRTGAAQYKLRANQYKLNKSRAIGGIQPANQHKLPAVQN